MSLSKKHNTNTTRRIMEHNNIIMDDFEPHNLGPVNGPVLAAVKKIVNQSSGADVWGHSSEHVREVRLEESSSNEMSFLVQFWKALIVEGQLPRSSTHKEEDNSHTSGGEGEEENQRKNPQEGEESRGSREYAAERNNVRIDSEASSTTIEFETALAGKSPPHSTPLKANWCADLKSSAVPRLCAHPSSHRDGALFNLIPTSHFRLATPRPDILYGLRRSAFSASETLINERFSGVASVSDECFHPFFLVECKMWKIEDAENQAARGGTTLVNARRKFNAQDPGLEQRQKTVPGADLDSFAFSMALTPAQAHLFVHWAEMTQSSARSSSATSAYASSRDPPIAKKKSLATVIYHMTILKVYRFTSPANVLSVLTPLSNDEHSPYNHLRHDLYNILDWGALKRRGEISEVCRLLVDRMMKLKDKHVENDSAGEEG